MKGIQRKYFLIFLLVLWIATLLVMVQNYNHYPPLPDENPLSNRINNIEGSMYKYGIFSFIELVGGILWIYYFFTLPVFYRFIIVSLSIGLVVWGFVDAMFSGGVVAAHALWLALEMVFICSYSIFTSIKNAS